MGRRHSEGLDAIIYQHSRRRYAQNWWLDLTKSKLTENRPKGACFVGDGSSGEKPVVWFGEGRVKSVSDFGR